MYARFAVVLCNGERTLRDGLSHAQKKGGGRGVPAVRDGVARCVRRACREGPAQRGAAGAALPLISSLKHARSTSLP